MNSISQTGRASRFLRVGKSVISVAGLGYAGYFTGILEAKGVGWNRYLLCFLAMLGALFIADLFERVAAPKD